MSNRTIEYLINNCEKVWQWEHDSKEKKGFVIKISIDLYAHFEWADRFDCYMCIAFGDDSIIPKNITKTPRYTAKNSLPPELIIFSIIKGLYRNYYNIINNGKLEYLVEEDDLSQIIRTFQNDRLQERNSK